MTNYFGDAAEALEEIRASLIENDRAENDRAEDDRAKDAEISGSPDDAAVLHEMPGAAPDRRPSQEEIAARAHEIYLERGGEEGRDVEDWLRAEAELTVKHRAATAGGA